MYAGTVWHVLVLLNSAVLGLSIEIVITFWTSLKAHHNWRHNTKVLFVLKKSWLRI